MGGFVDVITSRRTGKDIMKEILLGVLEFLGIAWWVEIVTENPSCTYYFGPFLNSEEAEAEKSGYIEDLEQEGAKGITVTIKRCKPVELTIFDEASDPKPLKKISPAFGAQIL
jgi:hypothetical protein